MPFQIKDFNSIALSEINHARSVTDKITDFQPGSVVRTLLEAPAAEIEELYIQIFLGLRDAIPVATFASFGFEKLPGAVASGLVNVSARGPLLEPIVIPTETTFTTDDGRVYTSTEEVLWNTAITVIAVPVRFSAVGTAGNASAGEISASPFFSADDFIVRNEAITNGLDEEADAAREARFADFIRGLSRGTTVACLSAARSAVVRDASGAIVEYVTRSGLTEVPGFVSLYVYSSIGAPSAALLQAAQAIIDGYRDEATGVLVEGVRAGGVRVDVLPMAERAISMGALVTMRSGYSLNAAVTQQLVSVYGSTIRAVQPESTLLLETLREKLLAVDGVFSVALTSPSNIVCAANEALVPGTLTVSPAS